MTRTPENRSDHPFDPTRKTALAVGILYLLTFIGSIPGALLMAPILTNPNYIAGPGEATQIVDRMRRGGLLHRQAPT
jgi:hypothetical protein